MENQESLDSVCYCVLSLYFLIGNEVTAAAKTQ